MRHLPLLLLLCACKPNPGTGPAGGRIDADGDGFVAAVDCDDDDPAIAPFVPEVCDGVDQNCDGVTDDGGDATFYPDADHDGFGDESAAYTACTARPGDVDVAGDCDDASADSHPGATESCSEDVDRNCDGSSPREDNDHDGYVSCEECDDGDALVNPSALEACNEVDDDCDGDTDEAGAVDGTPSWPDADGDTYGDAASVPTNLCEPDPDFVDNADDCDDASAEVHPGATESCNDIDDDCDGTTDPPTSAGAVVWFRDSDGDTYGDKSNTTNACEKPAGYVADENDCDDTDADDHPTATEVCDLEDDDCDGTIDEDVTKYYTDSDGDTYGAGAYGCVAAGHVTNADDCDDGTAYVYPGATELCDGLQNDCDDTSWTNADEDGLVSVATTGGAWSNATFTGGSSPKSYTIPTSGTVWFCRGAYSVAMTASTPNTTLAGRYGATDTTISGGGSKRIIDVSGTGSKLTIEDLTLTAGSGNANGGGAILFENSGGTLTLTNDIFDDNNATGPGGAVSIGGGTLTATDCQFVDNDSTSSSAGAGGAIYAGSTSTVTLETCDFTTNGTGGWGGAVLVTSSTSLTVTDCDFTENTAVNAGGGIYLNGSATLTLDGGTLEANEAAYGGGLAVVSATASVTDTIFLDNIAGTSGGGAYLYAATATMTDPSFEGNEADGASGGGAGGGGVQIESTSTVGITGADFTGNSTSGNDGGGLQLSGGTATITDCVLDSNESADEGGAIAVSTTGGTLYLVGTVLSNNTAAAGGGIDIDAGTVSCADSSSTGGAITKNTVTGTGGAVNLASGSFTSTACDFGTSAGSDDNSPNDIYAATSTGITTFAYGNNATFTCNTTTGCL